MPPFLFRRLVALVLTLVAATGVVFGFMEVLPGDPAAVILGTQARADTRLALRRELGLDQPPARRYLTWVGGLLQGDLGTSYTYRLPVSRLVAERLPVSLPLAGMALAVALALGVPVGVWAAARHRGLADHAIMGLAQLGVSVPNFWFAILLILCFSVELHWLPSGSFPGWEAGVGEALRSLVMPALALALPQAAILTRVTRASVVEVLNEDYVRTARAKGVSASFALWGHGMANALIPVVSILGLQFSFLLAGTIIIEQVFSLPGLGQLLFQAILQRDLILVQGLVVLLAGAVILVNFVVDVVYCFLDPRLRRGSRGEA